MKFLPFLSSACLKTALVVGFFLNAGFVAADSGHDTAGPFRRPVAVPFSRPLPSEPITYPDAEPNLFPSWVEFGLGEQAVAEKKFGEAVVDFRKAVERRGIYPEADWKLAEISGIGGDPVVREKLLERALEESGLLSVPEDRWEILYSLAQVRTQIPSIGLEKKSLAMDTYRQILARDPDYARLQQSAGLEGYDAAFFTRPGLFVYQSTGLPSFTSQLTGLNRVLYLYHHPVDFSLKAHQKIARLYLENKAYDQAEVHALYALTAIFSTLIDEVKTVEPDYVFHGLDDFFRDQNSTVFLGVPSGLVSSRTSPGSANPGWFVRWQEVHNFLNSAQTDATLATLVESLNGLAEREKLFPAPQGNRRKASEAASEIRGWLQLMFPNSPWNALLQRTEKPHG